MSFLAKVREHYGDTTAVPPQDPFDPARYTPGRGQGYARTALEAETQRVLSATPGTRNHTLNRAAFNLGQLVAGGELDETLVISELTSAAQLAGLDDREIAPTIASGLTSGATHPRNAPEPKTQVSSTFIAPMGVNASHGGDEGDRKEIHGETESAFLTKLRGALIDTHGLDHIPEPTPLIKGVLYMDSLAWLQGKPGNGKSFIALDLAGCVGSGQPWQGFGTPNRSTVLYLVAEGVSGVRQRVRAWEQAMGHPMNNVQFLPVAVQAANEPEWAALVQLAAELEPALVVVDTQARVTVGMEENAAKDMGLFVHRLEQIRIASRACVLVVHHQGRAGEHMRGSTAMEGAATTIISVAKEDDVLTVVNQKQKDAPPFDDLKLCLKSFGPSAIVTPIDLETVDLSNRPAIKNMIKLWWERHGSEPVSISVLVKSGVAAETTFHANKKHLENKGVIATEGTGRSVRYRLAKPPDHTFTPMTPTGSHGSQGIDEASHSHTPTTLKGGSDGSEATCPPAIYQQLPMDSGKENANQTHDKNAPWHAVQHRLTRRGWVAETSVMAALEHAAATAADAAMFLHRAVKAGRLDKRVTETPRGPHYELRLAATEPPCDHDPEQCPPDRAAEPTIQEGQS